MPIEVSPPKYVVVLNALQERIENGTYPAGSLLPSETQLMNEFGVSRPTAVRALGILKQDGWIESQQGKGSFVRSRPTGRGAPDRTRTLLEGDEDAEVTVLDAGPVLASDRAAAALGIDSGTPVVQRRRLLVAGEVGPVELSTVLVPVDLASGTGVSSKERLTGGLLAHLAQRHRITFDHATERISARPATADESRLLDVSRRDCVLTMLVVVHDRTGKPLVAIDVVLPTSRHELEDAYSLS